MYLVDVNILVYAVHRDAPRQRVAKQWLEERLAGYPQTLGLPWHSILGFLRLVANHNVFSNPVPVSTAWQQAKRWLDAPAVWVPTPGPRHRLVLDELVGTMQPAARAVADLHLAALAMENGLVLASADSAFGRIPGLRWRNPLAQA